MKQNEIKKPLIQSALVLLAAFILIGFVAGSNAHTFFGGLVSILKGIFFTVLLAIGLTLALLVSIVLLIAIFLGAVALYSPDTSKDMYLKLRQRLSKLYETLSSCRNREVDEVLQPSQPKNSTTATAVDMSPPSQPAKNSTARSDINELPQDMSKKISGLTAKIEQLESFNATAENSISELKKAIDEMPLNDLSQKTGSLEEQQQEILASLQECSSTIDEIKSSLSENSQLLQEQTAATGNFSDKIAELEKDLEAIRKENAEANAPAETTGETTELTHRIFSYLDKAEDKKKVAALVEEAVAQNMTYAEIDEFLSKSLNKKVDEILKEHPSLMKDFIRECKK